MKVDDPWEDKDASFRLGFARAQSGYKNGGVIEAVLSAIRTDDVSLAHISGAQAFADMFLGWLSTKEARKAEALKLEVKD